MLEEDPEDLRRVAAEVVPEQQDVDPSRGVEVHVSEKPEGRLRLLPVPSPEVGDSQSPQGRNFPRDLLRDILLHELAEKEAGPQLLGDRDCEFVNRP